MNKEILICLTIVAIVSFVVFGIRTYIKFKIYQNQKKMFLETQKELKKLTKKEKKEFISHHYLSFICFLPEVFEGENKKELRNLLNKYHVHKFFGENMVVEIPEDEEEYFCFLLERALVESSN